MRAHDISAVFKYILDLIYQIHIVQKNIIFNFCMKFKNIYIKIEHFKNVKATPTWFE